MCFYRSFDLSVVQSGFEKRDISFFVFMRWMSMLLYLPKKRIALDVLSYQFNVCKNLKATTWNVTVKNTKGKMILFRHEWRADCTERKQVDRKSGMCKIT